MFGIAGFDLSRLKRILFDFDSLELEASQGAYLLDYFEIDPDLEFDPTDYFDDRFLHESIQKSHLVMTDLGKVVLGILSKAKEIMKSKNPIKVADILTDYIQIFNIDDFVLKKKYKIAKVIFPPNFNLLIECTKLFWKMALDIWKCGFFRFKLHD